MRDLVTAIGLVFIIEGLLYALAPNRLKDLLAEIERLGAEKLRVIGLLASALGVAIVWLARTWGVS